MTGFCAMSFCGAAAGAGDGLFKTTEVSVMSKGIKIRREKEKSHVLLVLLIILGILAVSFMIVWAWQHFTTEGQEQASRHSSQSSGRKHDDNSSSQPALVLPTPEPEPTPKPVSFDEPVAESGRVSSSYFDNAVFVGDSITDGVTLYGVMNNATVLAGTGINLDTVYTSGVIKDMQTGARSSIMDNLAGARFERVYILLGGNEVRDIEKDIFIKRYDRLLDSVRETQPDAVIYVQSITPVLTDNQYAMRNDRISEYNEALQELCREKQVYYLDIAEALTAEDGTLQPEYAAVDGMHFQPAGYTAWFDYLHTHTVDARDEELEAPTDGESGASVSGDEPDGDGGELNGDAAGEDAYSETAQAENNLRTTIESQWSRQRRRGVINK